MHRCFSCITVHGMENGIARLSQQHYRLSKDDLGEEYRSEESIRRINISIRPDETRKSLFNRLNRAETWLINMDGKLEKSTNSYVNVVESSLVDLD